MKTIAARRLPSLFVIVSLCPFLSAGDPVGAKKSEPEKTHVLFMGTDLSVPRDKKYYRVEDVVGSEFKIKIGRKEFFVPTRNRATDLKVSHSLKLSGASVTLDDLQSGPGYTPGNDPVRKMIAASGAAGGAAAAQDVAQSRLVQVTTEAGIAAESAERSPWSQEARLQAEQLKDDQAATERRSAVIGHMLVHDSQNNAAFHADQMQGELAEGNYDAMEVSFKISSPVELEDPHMVVLFKFQLPEAKPGEEGMVIHAKALDPIGPKPKYIRVREGGLPRGFKFLDCTVHIYDRGGEVATNVSSKRVDLSRDEARQYLVIEHVGANRGATVPAAVVPGTLPAHRRQEFTIDQLNRICYAKISPDGIPLGVYVDESCQQELPDANTRSAIADLFFKPALEKGRPVEGVTRLSLGAI
jgi:hypothetical protein